MPSAESSSSARPLGRGPLRGARSLAAASGGFLCLARRSVGAGSGPLFERLLDALRLKLVEKAFPLRATYRSRGRHALGMIDSDLGFMLQPVAAGSTVSWSSVSIVNGTLASLAQGILVPLAKRQIKSLVKSFQDALQSSASGTRAAGGPVRGASSMPGRIEKEEAQP